MDPTTFDELTKRLATAGASRRRVLRGLGGGLAGAALAVAGLRPAGAAKGPGGNAACARFCASVFGADTPAADACTSEAAHGAGPCYRCGPAAAPDGCCSDRDCTPPATCGGGGVAGTCGTPVT